VRGRGVGELFVFVVLLLLVVLSRKRDVVGDFVGEWHRAGAGYHRHRWRCRPSSQAKPQMNEHDVKSLSGWEKEPAEKGDA
jgi:hypothetical protein